jgi:phage tail protein X
MSMANVYVTSQGEMVDAICRRFYGDESGFVEAVLAVNPGLAEVALPLASGVRITLPDIEPVTKVVPVVSLWD